MKKTTTKIKKVVAMVLVVAMAVSVLAVGGTDEIKAAGLSFKGKGTSTVTITENQVGKPQYIKIKPSVTGTVTVKFVRLPGCSSTGTLQLLNNKKKALDAVEKWKYFDTRTYGVLKGKTYYFKIQTDKDVQVEATVKAVKKYSNTSKKKAKTLKKGKAVTSVLIAGEKKSDWYKIKISKDSTIVYFKAEFKTHGDGGYSYPDETPGLKMTFYDPKGNVVKYSSAKLPLTIYRNQQSYSFTVPKGTCYIKVSPYTKNSSGQYTIKWAS